MGLESDYGAALDREIAIFARDEALPVAWPGRTFDPSSDVPGNGRRSDDPAQNAYLRVDDLPVPPRLVGVNNGESVHRWLQQITVCVRDGLDKTPARRRADALAAAFWYPRRIEGVLHTYTVIGTPAVAGHLIDAGWLCVPVTIPIQTIA